MLGIEWPVLILKLSYGPYKFTGIKQIYSLPNCSLYFLHCISIILFEKAYPSLDIWGNESYIIPSFIGYFDGLSGYTHDDPSTYTKLVYNIISVGMFGEESSQEEEFVPDGVTLSDVDNNNNEENLEEVDW